MLDLAGDLVPVLDAGEAVAVITVVAVARSAPLGAGASMAVTASGRVIGSISGGCVEGDAVLLARAVLASGRAETARLGFSDDQAHSAGLACGGSVDVVAYRIDPTDAAARRALDAAAADVPVTVGLVRTGERLGRVIPVPADDDVFVLEHRPRPRLIIAGAGEHAAALCRVASAAGLAVTVCDPWALLVTSERFPDADRLIVGVPHEVLPTLRVDERTAVCVLTHDERLDVPAIRVALGMPVGFVGAMGARSTARRRAQLLRQAGVPEEDLARLHSPLGLDLQGSSATETAVAVVAEIIAARRGGTGLPLRDLSGAIHRPAQRVLEGGVRA